MSSVKVSSIHSISITGRRKANEDYLIINKINNAFHYFSIFDGHGGHQVAEFVSEEFHKMFSKIKTYPVDKETIIDICETINAKTKKEIKGSKEMGTTVLILLKGIDDNYVQIINIGDCRAVISRNNLAIPLTKDHKPNWPEEWDRIDKLNTNNDPRYHVVLDDNVWRIEDLSVSRAIGDYQTAPYVSHKPDIYGYTLNNHDKFIVMACDGLWDVMENHDVCNAVENYVRKNETRTGVEKHLAHQGICNKSGDNISVIVIFFD